MVLHKKQVRQFLNVLLVAVLALSITAACTTVPKNNPGASMGSTDSTVPAEYVKINHGDNGGFLFFDADRNAFLSDGARNKFNLLVQKYHIQFRDWMLIDLKPDQGISPFVDQYGNHIWKMDRTVFKYFVLLNEMHRNGTAGDSTWNKALDKLLN